MAETEARHPKVTRADITGLAAAVAAASTAYPRVMA
jgi:hypothetical protein